MANHFPWGLRFMGNGFYGSDVHVFKLFFEGAAKRTEVCDRLLGLHAEPYPVDDGAA